MKNSAWFQVSQKITFCLVVGALAACSKPKDPKEIPKKCSIHTHCTAGYECVYPDAVPPGPHSLGECQEKPCAVTVSCDSQFSCVPPLTASCDIFDKERNKDTFCGCVGTNSEPIPASTTGDVPTTGGS